MKNTAGLPFRAFRLVPVALVLGALVSPAIPARADDDPFELFDKLRAHAGFSCQDLKVSGNAVVDSSGIASGGAASGQGHLRSNADIKLNGSVEVHGDVLAGPDGDVTINGGPIVTGFVGNADSLFQCQQLDLAALEAALEAANDNHLIPSTALGVGVLGGSDGREFFITGNDTLTLPAGTYIFSSLEITGGATVETAGTVRILVTGDVKITGSSMVNAGASPYLLRLWSSGAKLRVESQSVVHGFIYAPSARTKITGGAEILGATWVSSLELGGGARLTRIIDDVPPTVEITSPADGATVTDCEIEVTGAVTDDETGVILTLNDETVDVAADGSFTATVSLWTDPPGRITATAVDADGNETTVDVQVVVLPPTVTLVDPPPGSLVGVRVPELSGSAGTATEVSVNGVPANITDGSWRIAAFDLGADGIKTLDIVGSNCGGEAATTATLDLDTTPPVVTVADPGPDEIIPQSTVTVTGTAVDAHLLSVVVDGVPATITGETFTAVGVPLPNEGVNTLTVTATDALTRTTTMQRSVIRDTLDPVVTIASPPDGAFVTEQPITVSGTFTEANLASLTVNGIDATIDGTQFTASVGLTEGTNTITATATDLAGHSRDAQVTVTLDTTAPGVTITDPVSGLVTENSTTTVSGSSTEALSAVTVNGLAATVSGTTFSVNGVPLDIEGENSIIATAVDLAGNSAESMPVVVVRDTLAATVTMETAGLPSYTESAALVVTGTAVDPHLESVTVAGVAATRSGDQWSVELTLVEGDNDLFATAVDSLGHSASTAPITVSLDTQPPAIEITVPTDGAEIDSTGVTVEGTVTDPHLDPATVLVNGTAATITGDTFSVSLVLAEGESSLVAQADDLLGHTGTSSPVVVTVDSLPPVVTLHDLPDTNVSTPLVTVTGTVADPHLEQVVVKGVPAVVVGTDFTATDVALVEGSNLLEAVATDTFGHSATSNQIEIVLDTIPPTVAITSPTEGEVLVAELVTVTGTVADTHLDGVEVNGLAAVITGDTFTAENVPLLPGPNEIVAVARDAADNTTSATVNVVYDTAPPGVTIVSPATGSCLPSGQTVTVNGTVSSIYLTIDGGGSVSLELEVVDSDGVTATYPAVVEADDRSWSVETVTLGAADGTAILSATAIDPAGRTGVAAGSVRIDATPPVLTLLLDGAPFPGAAAGDTPPAGAVPVLINRVTTARVSIADGAYGAPEATLTLDGLPYVAGTPIDVEDDHLLVATATDCAGHMAAVHAFFAIDLTAPALLDTTPADGAQLTEGPTAFSGTADTELAAATVNGSPATITGTTFTITPLPWHEGDNSVEIVLTDLAGNQASFQHAFTVSTIEPTVAIIDGGLPIPDAAVYTRALTPDVRATPADATIEATLNGAPFTPGTAIDTTGDYTLAATASDGFGRTATDTVSFRVDLEAGPTIAITAPVDGAVLTEALVSVTGTVSGGSPTVSVNGAPAVVAADTFTIADLALEADVLNLITAIATDSAGRTASATVSVMVRSGGGQVLILEPVDGASTNRGAIDVAGVVVGGSRRSADGTVTVNGIVTPAALDGTFRTLDVPLVAGDNIITAEVTDPEGRIDTDAVTVHTDLEPPAIVLSADGGPLDEGAVFTQPVTITVTISDNMGDPPPPIVTLNGNPQPADAATVDVLVTEDGGYLLAVTATDVAGNERLAERSFTITGGGCGLADLEPADGSSVARAAVTLRGRSGSSESVTIRVPVPDTSPVTYNDYTADLADGTFVAGGVPLPAFGDNVLEIVCTGAGGGTATETLTIHRLPDGDGPAVEITSPGEGELLSVRTVTVAGTVSEVTAAVSINGRPATVTEQPDGSGVFTIDIPLTEGPNVIAARALDAAGRSGADRIIVWLDTRAPPVTITSPENNSWHGPRGDGSALVNVAGLVDLDSEPNLVDVVVSTATGSVTAIVDPDTGAFLAADVPLDPAANPADLQTITVTATDTRGQTETASIGVHFDAAGPGILLSTPPALGRYHEASPPNLTVGGDAWAAEGSSISVNGATIDPTILTWDGPLADGRFHTTFSIDILRTTDEGPFGVIARATQLDGRWAGTRRLLFVDNTAPEILEIHPADGSEGVDANSLLLVLFSEPVLHSSLTRPDGLSLTRLDTGDPVVGQLAVSGTAVAFVPGAAMAQGVDYRFRVGSEITDLVDHPLTAPQEVVFTTAADAISTAPQIDPPLPAVLCGSSLTVAGTAAPNTTVRVRDGDLSFTGTADSTGAFSVIIPLTGDGFHVLEVAAVDRSGTSGSPTTVIVRVDCRGPRIELASLDATNSLITIQASESIDPATATIGLPGAAIRLFDDNDPGAGDQQATVQVSPDGTTIELLLDPAPDAWWRDTVVRLVIGPPLADDNGIVMGAPFETLLFASGGGGLSGGFLFGETYDDTVGRPLAGATASLYPAGAALPGAVPAGTEDLPVAVATTDSRGRYQIVDEVAPGRYTLLLEAGDHVRVVRQLSLEPATGAIPFDSRLTPKGAEVGILDPVAGGTLPHLTTPLLQLIANPAAVPGSEALTVHLVERSGQGLPDALPLGWTPLAAADVVLTTSGDAVLADGHATAFDANSVHLELPLPDWVLGTDTLVAVHYHLAGGQWLTLPDLEFFTGPGDKPMARVELAGPGSVAVVLPDAGDGAPPLPATGADHPLRGVGLPDAMPDLTADIILNPQVVPPTGSAIATVVALSADGITPWPSGLAVQAYLEEQLILAGGIEQLIEAPYVVDLLLYRSRLDTDQLDGNDPESAGAVDFVVSPSERAAEVLLDVGYEHIRLYPFPGQLDRGQILGPGGGTVSAADGVDLTLPEGALPSKTVVRASLLSADDLAALPTALGYDTLAAIRVELGGHTLARTATLSLDVPAGAPDAIPGDPRLILAELIEVPADGRGAYPELTARIDRAATRLTAAPEAPDSGLDLDGLRREGLYLVLHAQSSIAFATGLVTASNGIGIELARVTNDGLGTADLSALGGRYAVPIQAIAGTTVEAAHPASDEGGSALIAAVTPGEVIALDIAIVPVAPTVVDIYPEPGIHSVGVAPYIDFSESLDPATVGPGTLILSLADAEGRPTGVRAAGEVSLSNSDSRINFSPSYPLAHGRTWVATFTGGVTDAGGTPYADGPVEWSFNTTTELAPGGQVHPELFHVTMPVDGIATVYGDTGAVPSDAWSISPFVVREIADPETVTVSATAAGAFSVPIGEPPNAPVTISDEVWVRVISPQGDIDTFRLSVFSSPDGRGFVAPVGQAVSFTVVDLDPETPDVTVDVPEGAFDRATMITVTHLDPNTIGVVDDLGLGLGGYIDVDFDGTAAETLVLKVSAPDDIADDGKVLIGEPVNLAWGRRLRLIGVGGVLEENGESFLSNHESVQPPIPDLTQGNLKLARDTDIFLALREAGSKVWYYEVDPLYGGDLIAFATFLADNQDAVLWGIFASAQADMWVFQAPPENWSGQVVLPITPGTAFTVEQRDAATGWLLSSQSYGNPDDPDGDGVIPLEAFLPPDPGPPLLVDASPFHVIRFSATEPDTTERLRLDLQAEVNGEGHVALTEPDGYEIAPGAGLALFEISDSTALDPRAGPALRCSEPPVLGKLSTGSDDLLAVVGPGSLDAESFDEFSFTFSRAIVGDVDELPMDDIAILTDRGPAEECGASSGERINLEAETRYNARTLVVRPTTGLRAGRSYEFHLKTAALFPEHCGTEPGGLPCAAPDRYFFTTRGGDADPVATGGRQLDEVRTLAKIGNLLFAGSLSGRVTATDLAGGPGTTAGSHVHHAEMVQGAMDQVRAFATDGHGRLFLNARIGGSWIVRAVAVEDVMAVDPPGGAFAAREGAIRTAFALGSDVGNISEFLALSALPLATPVDVEVLVRDRIDEPLELTEFCAELGDVCDLGEPDADGAYLVQINDLKSLPNRPNAVPREDSCSDQPNTDRFQRITLDNLSTGQSWFAEVLTAEWDNGPGPPMTFRARPGDLLRFRYNVQTLGFVALLGSGITVVDLNRFYDTALANPPLGSAQCGRRLGKYEGVEVELAGCGPTGATYGIDLTPSVGVLEPTGCDADGVCRRGAGRINLYSPLINRGLVHSQAGEDTPGTVGDGVLTCTRNVGAWHRDVAVARDVRWVDRGLRSSGPGQPFIIADQERFDQPQRVAGDVLFVSLGDLGIYVFDVANRDPTPQLIGRLWADGHSAYRLQVEQDLGIVLAGGLGGQLDVWDLHDINLAPGIDGLASPRSLLTLSNIPWQTDRLGVDRAGTGLIYTWAPRGEPDDPVGAIAFPIDRPQPIVAGVYRGEGEATPAPRVLRPTTELVPLGIPTELSLSEETANLIDNQRRYTAAFKVRLALPGALGDTVDARIESLLVRPPDEHLSNADLGPAKASPGGPGWPEPEQSVMLRRLAGADAGIDGRFGQAFNLYESDEIVLLIADPRAADGYTPQGDESDIASEAAQCRRCDRPAVLTDGDTVLEMLAGGPYLRVVLDVPAGSPLESFFGDDYPVPAAVVKLAGWADDVPSPVQASLVEPPLGAAGWSSGEAGVGASLVSGESLYSMVDHATQGRALGFAFERSYRSGFLSYNPLGGAGWTGNLFAHLRENQLTGEVAYHDGAGNVWRFFPASAPPHMDNQPRKQPGGDQPGDFWATQDRYHTKADPANSYLTPKGLYLTLRKMDGGSRWELVGPNNDIMTFDDRGRLDQIADRLRGNATEGEVRGNRVRFSYDAFSRLDSVVDDYGRKYFFRYHENADNDATLGLLKEIEDFAGRKIQYRYKIGGDRLLEQVEPPNVRVVSLASGVEGNPWVSYAYDPATVGTSAILHGELGGRRLKQVTLPGLGLLPTVELGYYQNDGRLETIDPEGISGFWTLGWVTQGTPPRMKTAIITAPWPSTTYYSVHFENDDVDLGRLTDVMTNVPVVRDSWMPTLPNEPPPTQPEPLTTRYYYEDDGSGRIESIHTPDDGITRYEYRDGSRVATLGVERITRVGAASDLVSRIGYDGGVDNLPVSITDDRERTRRIDPLAVSGEGAPPPVRRGFANEATPQLNDLVYTNTGLVDEMYIGVGSLKYSGTGLEKLDLSYRVGGGPDYLESIQRGSGPKLELKEYDDFGNATVLERSVSRDTAITHRDFDEWDQPYEVKIAENGPLGEVRQDLTFKHDLRGRLKETTRTQRGLGQITTERFYNDRGQIESVTTSGHAGPDADPASTETVSTTVTYDYDPGSGLLSSVESARHHLTFIERDSIGRVGSIELPAANGQGGPTVLHRGYDAVGRVVYLTDGDEGWWRGIYNQLGQLEYEYFADGTRVYRNFDVAGGLEKVEVQESDGAGGYTTLARSRVDVASFGAVTDLREEGLAPGTRHTRIDFDAAGRLTELHRGLDGVSLRKELDIHYADDASGRVDRVTDAAGNYTKYIYSDTSPWAETVVRHEPSPDPDGAESVVTLSLGYDLRGRARTITSSDGLTVTRDFDESGHLLSQELGGPVNRRTTYRWDGWGSLREMQRPDLASSSTYYGYDPDGNLVQRAVSRSGATHELTTMDYDAQGLLKLRTLPGSASELFFYHPDGALSSWQTRQLNINGDPLKLAYEYDEANRLTSRQLTDADDFTMGGLPPGMAGLTEVGDSYRYDGLGRLTGAGRLTDPVSGATEPGSAISYTYHPGDPRPLPESESIGRWSTWFPGTEGITRAWDIFDRLDNFSGPDPQMGLQDVEHDALDRRITVSTAHGDRFNGSYTWGGGNRLFGLTAGNLEQRYDYLEVGEPPVPGALLSSLTTTYGEPGDFGDLSALGALDYRWSKDQVKLGRDVLDSSTIFSEMGWGWTIDAAHRLTSASAGHAPCGADGACPGAMRTWEWPDFGPADEMLLWTDHLGTTSTVTEHGVNGRMLEIEHDAGTDVDNEALGYDKIGRRITDGRQDYLYSWRGEMVEVERTSGASAGHKVFYGYDSTGRLLERTVELQDGSFVAKRGYLWNDWELVAQIGLNFSDEPIWRVEHLPGPVGLDDSPQLAVTTHIHPSDSAPEVTRFFDLVRDEMGTVVAVLEDIEPPTAGTAVPPLKARILYDPYGQAHVELGPELRSVEHDPDATTVAGQTQDGLDAGPVENPVIGIAGSAVITTSLALDMTNIDGGITIERCDTGSASCVVLGPTEVVFATETGQPTRLTAMPVAGWIEGKTYRITLTSNLTDAYGRAFTAPEDGSEYTVYIGIPAGVEATDEPLPNLPKVIPLIFDNVEAAAETLECDGEACLPGGLNLLFQGLWTDPVTGIAYARNRWYDARTASWLSEDPKGAVDSPNLYAFVGWGPHVGRDPMGETTNAQYRGAYSRGGIEAVNRLPEVQRATKRAEWCQANREACDAQATRALLDFGDQIIGVRASESAELIDIFSYETTTQEKLLGGAAATLIVVDAAVNVATGGLQKRAKMGLGLLAGAAERVPGRVKGWWRRLRGHGDEVVDAAVDVGTGEVVYEHLKEGRQNYLGISGDEVRRSTEHLTDPEKTGDAMRIITGELDHDTARTVEAILIRERLDEALAAGIIDGTEPIAEQLRKAGLLNRNRGRVPSRWVDDVDVDDLLIDNGTEYPIRTPQK